MRCLAGYLVLTRCGPVAAAAVLLWVWGWGSACREADTPGESTAPPAPARPPDDWVDTADPNTPEADEPGEGAAATPSSDQATALQRPPLSATNLTLRSDARPDQWACYRMLNGYSRRLTVRRVHDDRVELVMEMFYRGHPVGLPAPRLESRRGLSPLAQAERRGARISFAEDRISAAGRTWSCLRATARWEDEEQGYRQDTWMSRQAPLSGLVLQETRVGSRLLARAELVSFGRRGSGELPCP